MSVSTTFVGIVGVFEEATQFDLAPAPLAFLALNDQKPTLSAQSTVGRA